MRYIVLALLFAAMAELASATDGFVAGAGVSEDAQAIHLSRMNQWDQRWFTAGDWHLTGYWETSLAYWRIEDEPGVVDASFTPVFRFRPNAVGATQPYWEAAIGLHLLSRTRIDSRRRLSGALQPAELIGFGVTFGDKSQYDIGYRFQHLPNRQLVNVDDGISLHQLRLTYLY